MTERGNVRRDIVQKRYLVSTEEPSEPRHRVTSQKSVFVQPKQGYIDPNEAEYQIVYIPVRLKTSMLELKCQRLFRPKFSKVKTSFFVEIPQVSDTLTPSQ